MARKPRNAARQNQRQSAASKSRRHDVADENTGSSARHVVVYGRHAVLAVLKARLRDVYEVRVLNGADAGLQRDVSDLVHKHSAIALRTVDDRAELDAWAGVAHHQGIAAQIKPAEMLTESWLQARLDDLPQTALFLLLDGVQDPHNLGACLRTAAAAGATAVIAPKDKAVGLTPVVRKVSVGASEIMPLVQVTNLSRTMQALQQAGAWLYGLAGETDTSLYAGKFSGPVGIVMGAEGPGLRRLTREYCDGLVKIPMPGADMGLLDSLNVSVATGITLFEVQRQRGLLEG